MTELTEVGLFLGVLFCFDVVINGIVSLISLSDLSLLVYRNARDFTLLNSLIGTNSFPVA